MNTQTFQVGKFKQNQTNNGGFLTTRLQQIPHASNQEDQYS